MGSFAAFKMMIPLRPSCGRFNPTITASLFGDHNSDLLSHLSGSKGLLTRLHPGTSIGKQSTRSCTGGNCPGWKNHTPSLPVFLPATMNARNRPSGDHLAAGTKALFSSRVSATNCEKGDISGRFAPAPSTPVKYMLPLLSVVTYKFGSTGLRSNSTVSFSKLNPPVVTPPDVLKPNTRLATTGGLKSIGAIGIAVTIPGSVTIKATVGCGVGVKITSCGVTSAGIGVTNGVSIIGACAVMKVGVTSSVGSNAISGGVAVGTSPTGAMTVKVTSSSGASVRVGVGCGRGVLLGVDVGASVGVSVGVLLGNGVSVGSGVGLNVIVSVAVGTSVVVSVGSGVSVGNGVGLAVSVGVALGSSVGVSVAVDVGSAVFVGKGVLVDSGVGLNVIVGVKLGVSVGALVAVSVGVSVGVKLGVTVGVSLGTSGNGVGLGSGVSVGGTVAVALGKGVSVAVLVGVKLDVALGALVNVALAVTVAVKVDVGVSVSVNVGVNVAVALGSFVSVRVGGTAVLLGSTKKVAVKVGVELGVLLATCATSVGRGVFVTNGVGLGVRVGAIVGVTSGTDKLQAPKNKASRITLRRIMMIPHTSATNDDYRHTGISARWTYGLRLGNGLESAPRALVIQEIVMRPALIPLEHVAQLPLAYRVTIPDHYRDKMGHMNMRYYLEVYDDAGDALFETFGLTPAFYKQNGSGGFDLEHHIHYLNEVHIGDTVAVYARLVDRSAKRLHYLLFMVNESRNLLASIYECVNSYADLTVRKTAPYPEAIATALDGILANHQQLTWDAPVCGVMSS